MFSIGIALIFVLLPKTVLAEIMIYAGKARQLKDKKKEMMVKSKTSGVKVIDKAEPQGMINNSGEIALKKGYHYLRVLVMIAERFQRVGQDGFIFTYGNHKSNQVLLNNSLLYHT